MKLSFYFDVFQWTTEINPPYIFSATNPQLKADNAIRYKVTVEIPDPVKPDIELEGIAVLDNK